MLNPQVHCLVQGLGCATWIEGRRAMRGKATTTSPAHSCSPLGRGCSGGSVVFLTREVVQVWPVWVLPLGRVEVVQWWWWCQGYRGT